MSGSSDMQISKSPQKRIEILKRNQYSNYSEDTTGQTTSKWISENSSRLLKNNNKEHLPKSIGKDIRKTLKGPFAMIKTNQQSSQNMCTPNTDFPRRSPRITMGNGPFKSVDYYNEQGKLITNNLDLCDCLDSNCPGCFYSCPSCSGTKCGPTCRANRKFMYNSIEYDGSDKVLENKYLKM